MSSADYATRFFHERVYVFSLKGCQPGPDGWRARDFSEGKDHIWAGILKLTSSTATDKNFVILEHDKRDGKTGIFAQCEATKENIEPTVDSSRFFVLRLTSPSGQYAFIGMGFNDKQPALDFKAELASLSSKSTAKLSDIDIGDLSLPANGKIVLNLGGKSSKPASTSAASGSVGLDAFALAPPPSASRPTQAAASSSGSADLASFFGASTQQAPKPAAVAAAAQPAPATAAAPAAPKKFDFGDDWNF